MNTERAAIIEQRAKKPVRILSLGAGVQSSTLAMLYAKGKLPAIDSAVFADTGSESKKTYAHLKRLTGMIAESEFPFPVHIVRKSDTIISLRDACFKTASRQQFLRFPAFVVSDKHNGRGRPGGAGSRGCTETYKVLPILRETRRQIGVKRLSKTSPVLAVHAIGISLDEAHRMKPSKDSWLKREWPLVYDLEMTRQDCVAWWKEHIGGEPPPSSSCTFCPFHSTKNWQTVKQDDPDAWEEAVELDKLLRTPQKPNRGLPYEWYPHSLHYSGKPLEEAVEVKETKADDLFDLFGNECEGICGV